MAMPLKDQSPPLRFYAGERALARLREHGLRPEDVSVIAGAAGGPKALGLVGLDEALFGDWLPRAPRERHLIGASIGSWRSASLCLPDPVAGIRRLSELYTQQRFPKGISMAEVSRKCEAMLSDLLQDQDEHVLTQSQFRLNVVVNASRWRSLQADTHPALALGLAGVIAANTVNRRFVANGFERIIVHDPRDTPPLGDREDLPTRYAMLTPENLRATLLASGSIPTVMEAVNEIPGVPGRAFRDGGLTDYHLDLPYQTDGIVLFPHFRERIVPGWFDKLLPWRGGDPERLADLLLVAPSHEYLAELPDGQLPDRKDFVRYSGDDETRERHWHRAMQESRRLGEYFLEQVDRERFVDEVRPLSELRG